MDVDNRRDSTNASGNNRPKETVDGEMYTAAAEQSLTDTPTAPGTVATPVLSMCEDVEMVSSIMDTPRIKATGDLVAEMASTSGEAKEIRSDERCRILRDVDKAELMREEIARTNPEFASVSSFLGTVCGESHMTAKDKVSGESGVEETSAEGGKRNTERSIQQEQRYIERQRLTRITAAKSLLKEELAKKNPVEAFVNAYRKAPGEANDSEGLVACQNSETEGQGLVPMQQEFPRVEQEQLKETMKVADEKVGDEFEMEIIEEPETVISDDVEMSNADSGDEGSGYSSTIGSSESSES